MKQSRVLIFAFAWLLFAAMPTRAAHAATLFFSPSSGSYKVGQTFSVGVFVSSPDQAVNAVSGDVLYPTDILSVSSVSKAGIISLWVQEPVDSGGKVHFEGISLNPGYTGKAGRIVTITFKAKIPGDANLRIASAQALANDGQGTSILAGVGTARFTITSAAPVEVVPPPAVVPPLVPAAPKVSSSVYADPTHWYQEQSGSFLWRLPADTTGVSWVVDQNPSTIPPPRSLGLVSSASVNVETDGVWYFHIRFENSHGWGATTHYKFQVDHTPPDSFEIVPLPRPDPTEPTASFQFIATDTVSGIDHYEISLDQGAVQSWQDPGSHTYVTPALAPGNHHADVEAVDRAGNRRSAVADWRVEGGINPPTITDYPKLLPTDSWLVVRGESYANATIMVFLQREQQSAVQQSVTVDAAGHWLFVSAQKLENGKYQLWVTAKDTRGNQSAPSARVTIEVRQLFFWLLGFFFTSPVFIWVLLTLLSGLIGSLIVYHGYSLKRLENSMRGELKMIQTIIKKEALNRTGGNAAGHKKLLEELKEAGEELKRRLRNDGT